MEMEMSTLEAEIRELETLLKEVKTEGNQRDLKVLLQQKQQRYAQEEKSKTSPVAMAAGEEDAVMEEMPTVEEVPKKAEIPVVDKVEEDAVVYAEISRFGWEDEGYGKDKVSVYIMSGIDGVGDLPKENVECKFTKDSFDLTIRGLHGKNYRLVRYNLDKEIDPSKSKCRVKKNRVSLTLWKKDKNNSWMTLIAKNPQKQKNLNSKDPTAGIMDMMREMYEDGDEDMKRTIAKAWTESREKQQAGGL